MSWGNLNVNAYKAADLSILIKVIDSNEDAYEFSGTNVINVYQRFEKEPILEIALSWDGTYYTGSVDAADLDLVATIYRLEWINSNATTRPIVTGNFTLSDVFTDTRATAEATLTVDTTTFDVTVSDSDVAATAALAAAAYVEGTVGGTFCVIADETDYIEFIAFAPATVTEGQETLDGVTINTLEMQY